MRADWDAIFDAEALLKSQEALLRFGSREEGVATLYDMLKVYEEGAAR